MDFGRRADIEGVDFGLGPIDALGASSADVAAPKRLYLGAPAWAKRRWVGRVYPEGTAPSGYLAAYGAAYGAVELNATFYRTPSEEEGRAWASACPADFRFAPKVPKTIALARGLVAPAGEIDRFVAFVGALGERAGPSLLSLPPSLSVRDLPRLEDLVRSLPPSVRLAVEPRHESWFSERALVAPARDVLRALGVTAVVTDVAGRRDVSHGTWTTRTAFVRFVGNALHPTDFTRIDAWAERLAELFALGLEEAYFFVHEPDDETTPEILSHAADRFSRATGLEVRAPRVPASRGQLALF